MWGKEKWKKREYIGGDIYIYIYIYIYIFRTDYSRTDYSEPVGRSPEAGVQAKKMGKI